MKLHYHVAFAACQQYAGSRPELTCIHTDRHRVQSVQGCLSINCRLERRLREAQRNVNLSSSSPEAFALLCSSAAILVCGRSCAIILCWLHELEAIGLRWGQGTSLRRLQQPGIRQSLLNAE